MADMRKILLSWTPLSQSKRVAGVQLPGDAVRSDEASPNLDKV